MKKLFFAMTLLVVATACQTENLALSDLREGLYTGTFIRGTPTSLPKPVQVRIQFGQETFEGSSDEKLPVICKGTFQLKNDSTVNFTNYCFFTADFDWTYILEGEFTIRYDDPFVYLTKRYPDGQTYDVYKLERVSATIQ